MRVYITATELLPLLTFLSDELVLTEGSIIVGDYKLVTDIKTDGYSDQAYPDSPIVPVRSAQLQLLSCTINLNSSGAGPSLC